MQKESEKYEIGQKILEKSTIWSKMLTIKWKIVKYK